MGTLVTIEVVPPGADAAIERAFEWFRTIEAVCTRFDDGSELNRVVARPGTPVAVSPILFEAIQFALHVAAESGGAFDPTVGGYLHERGFDRDYRSGSRVVPPHRTTDSESVSYRDVVVDAVARTVTVRRPLILDLGAVAKGLAVDVAARELRSFNDYAIDAGGDLYLAGVNADNAPWSVGIRHPRTADAVIASLRVRDAAVCTSGDYERPAASDGHHLVDARTGESPSSVASVSVMADSAMLADALATAAFVLGAADGLAFLERLGAAGLLITPDLQCTSTSGWPSE